MADYEPVDLSAVCNAGVEVLGDAPAGQPLGQIVLRGLPFLIGTEPPVKQRCFVVPDAPTSIDIGRRARRIIVVHRQLRPAASAGHGIGTTVAEYAFHLAGGQIVTVPIRERFEIQVVPTEWGRSPFLAVSDTHDGNLPRFEGPWDEAGGRLTEHHRGPAAAYYCWAWTNPRPDAVIERVELIPRGVPFLVAAVTLGHADEHPFVRSAARPARLVVTAVHHATRVLRANPNTHDKPQLWASHIHLGP